MTSIHERMARKQPTTTAQRAIWIGQAMEPENSAYNVAVRVDITGELNIGRFECAIIQTVRMADALNAHYVRTDDVGFELLQCTHTNYIEKMNEVDLRHAVDPEQSVSQWTAQDLSTAIDLAIDPIFCVTLFYIADNQYVLYFRAHHIALDAYGLALILQRIEQRYNASFDLIEADLPDFESSGMAVEDEQHFINSPQYQRSQDFWLDYMANMKRVVSFVDKSTLPAPVVLRKDFIIPRAQVALIELIARQYKTSNAFIVLSAVAVYLGQVTDAQDLVLGIPMMGRMSHQSLMVPTTLANILPLRLQWEKNTPLSQTIERVMAQMALIKNHQYYRAETLRQQLNLVGGNRRLVGPTFNIDIFQTKMLLKKCDSTIHPLSTGPINDFAVTLKMKKSDGTIPLIMMANPRTYDEQTFSHYAMGLYHYLAVFLQEVNRSLSL